MERTEPPVAPARRGVLAGLVLGGLALVAERLRPWVAARERSRKGSGCRRVLPWSDEDLHRPHDRAG